jgi:hypothetical protein
MHNRPVYSAREISARARHAAQLDRVFPLPSGLIFAAYPPS